MTVEIIYDKSPRKYVAGPGLEPATPWFAIRLAPDCARRPGYSVCGWQYSQCASNVYRAVFVALSARVKTNAFANVNEIGQSLLTRSCQNLNLAFKFRMLMDNILYNLAQCWGNVKQMAQKYCFNKAKVCVVRRCECPLKKNVGKQC